MRHLLSAALLALLGATPALAAPDCDLTATVGNGGLQASYDPFAAQNTVVTLQVSATNTGSKQCNARFYVAPLDGTLRLRGPSQTLTYRIDGPNGGGGGLPNERGPFVLHVAPGATQTLSIPFTILPQQIVGRGDYVAELALRGLRQGNEPVDIAGANPIITLNVPSRLEMSISGAAAPPFSEHGMAPASMNFPDAQTGQSQRVFVNVWANSSVNVTLTSENQGVLRHLEGSELSPIRYSATFDGAPISLGAPYTVGRTPPMSLQGASYELGVTLGDTSRSYAGTYRDIITVDVNQN